MHDTQIDSQAIYLLIKTDTISIFGKWQ